MEQSRYQHGTGLVAVGVLVGVVCAVLLGSCAAAGDRDQSASALGSGQADLISREELRARLERFGERFSNQVQGAANDIAIRSEDREVDKRTVLWKIRAVESLWSALAQRDPRASLLDAWTLSLQMEQFFREGDGSQLFAPNQEIAITAATDIVADIERIASLLLDEDRFRAVRVEIDQFVDENPIRGEFAREANLPSTLPARGGSLLRSVTSVPMAPFRAISGIDEGAQAVRQLSDVAADIGEIAESLPERTRWQAELLLYAFEDRESVQRAVESVQIASESMRELARTADSLPARIGEETRATLVEVERRSEALRATIREAGDTIERLDTALARADVTMKSANETAVAVESASASLAEAGDAWTGLAEEVREIVAMTQTDDAGESTGAESSMSLQDVTNAADRMAVAATELRGALSEVATLISSEDWSRRAGELEAHTESWVNLTGSEMRALTNYVFWRLVALAVIVFALAAIFRIFVPLRVRKQEVTA
ncbi:MAG: hypothetical protein ACF8PN_02965 [Phycisphaerales bacterium]